MQRDQPTTAQRIDRMFADAPFLNLSPEHLVWMKSRLAVEIETAKLDAMETLASALRKFAPDLSADLAHRHTEAAAALDKFVEVLQHKE